MEEDKKEEDIQITSQVSSMQENNFVDPSSTQITNIEDQLKKAQDTLLSLQKIKQQLEQERKAKIKAAEAEQEKVTSQKLKEENNKLKRELHEYQDEINSLKDIISVFKNDLLKTAEHLQSRVSSSLDRMEGQSHNSRHQVVSHTHRNILSKHHVNEEEEKKSHNNTHRGGFFGQLQVQTEKQESATKAKLHDHEVSTHADEHAQASEPFAQVTIATPEINTQVSPMAASQPSAVLDEKKEEVKETVSAQQEEEKPELNPIPVPTSTVPTATQNLETSQSSQASQSQETVSTPPISQAVVTEPVQNSSQAVADTTPAPALLVVPNKNDNEEKNLNEEMSEYDEIKRELEALENESVFGKEEEVNSLQENKVVQTEPDNSLVNTNSVLKNLINIIAGGNKHKKPKVPEMVKAIKAEPMSQNSAEFKEQFWQGGDNSQQNQQSNNSVNTVDPIKTESHPVQSSASSEMAGATNNFQSATNTAQESPSAVNIQQASVDSTTAQTETQNLATAGQSPVQIKKLHKVFKKKKKIIKESKTHDLDKEDHHKTRKGMGAMGKMAIKTAVVILILFSGLVAYKLKNADQLRESYMSKAKENVVQAGKASNAPPAGFSDLPVEERYKEAYAEVRYEDTIWTEYNDSDLGVKLKYPQNATYRVKPIGSNNLWFLRKNGYLLKIERIDTEQTLEEMAISVSGDISYKQESLEVKDNPTIHMILQETLPVMGNIYLVKVDATIYKVWYKTFVSGESPDDEQRLKTLLDTLEFTRNGQ